MWIINCGLLILGTVAALCGTSFYLRNREASGNIRFYIFSYGLCAAVWCYFFGVLGFCDDLELCNLFRKIGDIGVVSFLITETFLITDISGINPKITRIFKTLAIVAGFVDYLFFTQDNVNIFVRQGNWTTWTANPDGSLNRAIHSAYIAFTFLVLFFFGVAWMHNNRVKRLRRFLFFVFAANFTMLFFTIPDTFLPAIGRHAIATSGIGAALCTVVMWYGATQLGSFDIRMGNIKDGLFDFIEAGVIVLDVDKKIAMMNQYSRNLAEKRKNEKNGLEDFFDITAEKCQEMFRTSADSIYADRLWDKERKNAYSVRLSAVKDSYEEIFCFLCVFVDVTEEVEAVAQAKVANMAKSRFLAQMSHEIRTPINAVLGMNEMILREAKDSDILEYAGNIDSAGNTLLSLINSILDFSKIEDGKMDIVPVKYDTASFVNDLYHSIIQRADTKGLAFVLHVDETLPCELVGDDVRFSQVIMNLLTNAVKYTEKGTVTLSIQTVERNEKTVKIAVSVRDTGIGIKDEDRVKLFESFGRLDEVRNHNIEGTGLGMSIITSLLEMMGSSLKLESTYGKGSEFSFVIEQTIADAAPIGNYEERLKESVHRGKKNELISAPKARVLLVDDNEMNLKVARNLLKLCKIKPDMVLSGSEAIEHMRKNRYDIVFLDHMMPGMDGMETLKHLQEENLIPENTTVIVLTANAVVGARESYLAAGFRDYLSKPIEINHMIEKLKEYLPREAYETEQDHVGEAIVDTRQGDYLLMEFPAEDEMEMDGSDLQGTYDRELLEDIGIDIGTGLKYCAGNEGWYFEMLSDFVAEQEAKSRELNRYFERCDWKDYKVKVHALKSNAKTIGERQVYQLAKSLEDAADREDGEYIKANQGKLLLTLKNSAEMIAGCRR